MKSILAVCYLLMMTPAFAAGLLFSQMKDGDKMQVKMRSSGCFDDNTYYFEVIRKDGSHLFIQYKMAWRFTKAGTAVRKKLTVGHVPLSKEDISGLDCLLDYYRAKKTGASTSTNSLEVTFRHGNGLSAEERLTDRSGGTVLGNPAGTVTFFQLMARFPEKAGS